MFYTGVFFKPGNCPDVAMRPIYYPPGKEYLPFPLSGDICGELCKFDSDCYGDQKCCYTDCGRACANPSKMIFHFFLLIIP